MAVELTREPESPVEVGTGVELRLRFGDRFAKLDAVVRHRKDMMCGLFFPGCVRRDGTIDPPDDLRDVVLRLEREWMRNKGRQAA